MKNTKRILLTLLVAALLATLLPVSAFAKSEVTFGDYVPISAGNQIAYGEQYSVMAPSTVYLNGEPVSAYGYRFAYYQYKDSEWVEYQDEQLRLPFEVGQYKVVVSVSDRDEDYTGSMEYEYSIVSKGNSFEDLPENDWFTEGVTYCLTQGLMTGVSETKFAPKANTTRAMMMTILARMDGCDTEGGELWYSIGQSWAMTNGISDGTNPDGNITREQFATMLYNYAKMQGKGFTGSWMFLLDAKDASDISSWANEAMHWCVMKGILTGYTDGTLKPAALLTRAEAAVMIERFCTLSE